MDEKKVGAVVASVITFQVGFQDPYREVSCLENFMLFHIRAAAVVTGVRMNLTTFSRRICLGRSDQFSPRFPPSWVLGRRTEQSSPARIRHGRRSGHHDVSISTPLNHDT